MVFSYWGEFNQKCDLDVVLHLGTNCVWKYPIKFQGQSENKILYILAIQISIIQSDWGARVF